MSMSNLAFLSSRWNTSATRVLGAMAVCTSELDHSDGGASPEVLLQDRLSVILVWTLSERTSRTSNCACQWLRLGLALRAVSFCGASDGGNGDANPTSDHRRRPGRAASVPYSPSQRY